MEATSEVSTVQNVQRSTPEARSKGLSFQTGLLNPVMTMQSSVPKSQPYHCVLITGAKVHQYSNSSTTVCSPITATLISIVQLLYVSRGCQVQLTPACERKYSLRREGGLADDQHTTADDRRRRALYRPHTPPLTRRTLTRLVSRSPHHDRSQGRVECLHGHGPWA
ncbi:hypothetical protein NEOLEDRAFT_567686 [Neolentinus lepideus HHB14362 ss-1]|uniref:Uncharacterized protein n=1 Tax=Neolentinus lepideus HHB14362 ss-1 TaxID=1314782 RepID=A0A165QZ25_9AGAM|nr:hypothetical protein NEOLEDRAFT_567686 [Neolentinus lepideus HHB14362 ss-1]